MIKYQDNITARLNGGALQPVAGATISVSTRAGAPAVIYADDGVTVKPQPLVTDNNGHFQFRALNGEYVLTISAAQFATFTREIELLDVDDVNEALTALANVQETTHAALALVDAELVAIAASGGAAKVGYGTDTVAGSLDALQMADYTALRAYSGARKNVYVTDLATAGMFVRDDADTAVLGTPVNTAFSTAITGGTLAAGTYYYRVSAIDAYGETLASAETSIAAAKLAAPAANAPTTATTGGTLAAATYYYKVTALGAAGETIGSNEVSIATTGTTSTVTVTWGAVTGATGYRVYRGTAAGGQNAYYAPGNVTTFTDTGAASTAGSVPTANTATTNTNTVTVNWGAVTGATGYKVYGRAAGAQLFMAKLGAVTTWTDTGSITPAGALPTGYKKDNGSTVIQSTNGKRWKRDGFTQSGTGAVLRTMQDKARETVSVKDFGAVGDGVADDTAAIQAAIDALPVRGTLLFPPAVNYKITDKINIFNKPGCVIDFNNQQINAASMTVYKEAALHFKQCSEAVIKNIYVIGHRTNTGRGVWFDAADGEITIHAHIKKVRVANCVTAIQVGSDGTWQVSDSFVDDLYGTDSDVGVLLTGENTLGMIYNRVAAYNNTAIGVHLKEGGGLIMNLGSAASGSDIYVGATTGLNHSRLSRWDINSGYSEEGVNDEIFINSAACADTSPFREQIVFSGFRCTPFSTTNVVEFIQWNLNGDLIFRDSAFNHGQQLPHIKVGHNATYRAPRVVLDDCVIDCSPTTAVQVPMSYAVGSGRQIVEINARVNNGMTFWQNNGAANEGTIQRGIDLRKLAKFEQALLNIGNLKGAWSLRDITSGTCRNLVLGGASLATSTALEQRDFWLDDGLVGFLSNGTTAKTISTSSADYAAAAEYTFGAILRPTSAGTGEENTNMLGGAAGMRIALYDNAGGALLCLVGGLNAFAPVTNPYDPHLVTGRYVSGASVKVNAINLRTGQIISATNTTSIPAFETLTWANGVSLRNVQTVRGFPFVYGRAITDSEVSQLQQAALLLTDSWRLA